MAILLAACSLLVEIKTIVLMETKKKNYMIQVMELFGDTAAILNSIVSYY